MRMSYDTEYLQSEVDEVFNIPTGAVSGPSTTTSFSSAPSPYGPYTPGSQRSTPEGLAVEYDSAAFSAYQQQLSPSSSGMSEYMFGHVKGEPEPMSFLPMTPMKKMDGLASDYDGFLSMTPSHSMASNSAIVYSNPSPGTAMGPASYMMTPSQSFSGSEVTEASLWMSGPGSPAHFYHPQRALSGQSIEDFNLGRNSPLHMHASSLRAPPSPSRSRAHRGRMLHESQRRSSELHRRVHSAGSSTPRKRRATELDESGYKVVGRPGCKCDYPGCEKAFQRNEHLKRHKQTFHGEGPNKFQCEFCGKNQFNRQDNLNNHRKLHARPNARNRGVEFMPQAVQIIAEEERSRKKRAPSRSKLAKRAVAEAAAKVDGMSFCEGY